MSGTSHKADLYKFNQENFTNSSTQGYLLDKTVKENKNS